ncbi:uncharacterized protein LOC144744895 [Ciona intestinalis]
MAKMEAEFAKKFGELQDHFDERITRVYRSLTDRLDQLPTNMSERRAKSENADGTKVSGFPVRKDVVKLKETFNGTDWWGFKRHFMNVSMANGWTEEVKGFQLACCLKGEALFIQNSLPESKRLDFESLSKAFNRKYEKSNSVQCRGLFFTARQDRVESPIDFAYRLQSLFQEADVNVSREDGRDY